MHKKTALIFLLLFGFLGAYFAKADQVGITVDQSFFTFSTDPGTVQTIKLHVSNTSEAQQKMSAVPEDFIAGNNNEISGTTAKNEQFGMKDWVSTVEPDWILNPGETKEIELSVSIPKDATVGAHYSIVNIQAFPKIDGQNFQNTIVGGQVGVYLLLNVNGKISGSGELKNFNAPVVIGKDVQMKAEFENTGNILYIPHGEIRLQNLLTRKKSAIESEKHFVFPGTKYSFEFEWSPESVFGAYQAQAIFTDANGATHAQWRFFFGKLFFLIPAAFLLICFFAIVLIIRKRKAKRYVL